MILQWELTLENAEEFFRRVNELEEDTEKAREQILTDMAREGLVKSLCATERSMDQLLKDKAEQYGKVLYLGGDDGTCASEETI